MIVPVKNSFKKKTKVNCENKMSEIGYKKITEIKQYKTKITLIQIKEIIAMKKKMRKRI